MVNYARNTLCVVNSIKYCIQEILLGMVNYERNTLCLVNSIKYTRNTPRYGKLCKKYYNTVQCTMYIYCMNDFDVKINVLEATSRVDYVDTLVLCSYPTEI